MRKRESGAATPKQVAVGAAALILMGVSGWFIWRQCSPRRIVVKPLTLCCAECGKVFRDQQVQTLPIKCPACGKVALGLAVQCYECGHIFAQPPLRQARPKDPMAGVAPTKCPKCSSTYIGEPRPPGEPLPPRPK